MVSYNSRMVQQLERTFARACDTSWSRPFDSYVDTIFDNTIGGFSMEFDVDSSMQSIWTVPWNPYGIVHEFTM